MSKIQISSHAFYQQLEDQAVILNLQSEQYYTLDHIGRHMWELLQKYGNIEDVVSDMNAKYDVSEHQLRQDLEELVANLVSAGLLNVI